MSGSHTGYFLKESVRSSIRVATARTSPQGNVKLAVARGLCGSATRRRHLVATLQEPEPDTT